jgi:hypothetical protein
MNKKLDQTIHDAFPLDNAHAYNNFEINVFFYRLEGKK